MNDSRRVRVKICGVTRVQDALAAEAAGADAVGFVFATGSKRLVTVTEAAAMSAAMGPFCARVGVFVDATKEEIENAVSVARLDAVQLHGSEPPELAAALRRRLRVIRAVSFATAPTPADLADYPADAILLDAAVPGSGVPFPWEQAAAWRAHPKLLLAGGLNPDNVASGVRALLPYAVDVSTGVEEQLGSVSAPPSSQARARPVKDPAEIRRFIAATRNAAAGA